MPAMPPGSIVSEARLHSYSRGHANCPPCMHAGMRCECTNCGTNPFLGLGACTLCMLYNLLLRDAGSHHAYQLMISVSGRIGKE